MNTNSILYENKFPFQHRDSGRYSKCTFHGLPKTDFTTALLRHYFKTKTTLIPSQTSIFFHRGWNAEFCSPLARVAHQHHSLLWTVAFFYFNPLAEILAKTFMLSRYIFLFVEKCFKYLHSLISVSFFTCHRWPR